MKIIKEVCGDIAILRTETYNNKLILFFILYIEAMKDFPNLNLSPKDVQIAHFAGDRFKGTFGIEFNIYNANGIPTDYQQISELELTL